MVRGHSKQRWIAFAKWTHTSTSTHAHTLSKVLCLTEKSSPEQWVGSKNGQGDENENMENMISLCIWKMTFWCGLIIAFKY